MQAPDRGRTKPVVPSGRRLSAARRVTFGRANCELTVRADVEGAGGRVVVGRVTMAVAAGYLQACTLVCKGGAGTGEPVHVTRSMGRMQEGEGPSMTCWVAVSTQVHM